MTNMIFYKNNLGMSIAEVMIALGLAGGISLVIMKNMEMQTKANKTSSLNNNVNDMKRLFQDFVGRTEPCNASFTGRVRGENIPYLRTKDTFTNEYFAKADGVTEFRNTGLAIEKMRILTLPEELDMPNAVYSPLGSSSNDFGVGPAILRVHLKKLIKNGKQTFYGGSTLFFDVIIIAEFLGNSPYGQGSSQDQAAQSWQNAFKDEEAAKKTAVDAQFNSYIATHPNHQDFTAARADIKITAEMGYSGYAGKNPQSPFLPVCSGTTGATTQGPNEDFCGRDSSGNIDPKGPYNQIGTYYVINWRTAHPLESITDCGNHLSTGVR